MYPIYLVLSASANAWPFVHTSLICTAHPHVTGTIFETDVNGPLCFALFKKYSLKMYTALRLQLRLKHTVHSRIGYVMWIILSKHLVG